MSLSINSGKTMIIPFTRKRNISNMKAIRLDGTLIECKSEVKYLGITLDKKLLWNRHSAVTTNKAARALMICRNVGSIVVTYGAITWCQKVTQVTARNTLDKLQQLACVCITGAMSKPGPESRQAAIMALSSNIIS
ncbi:hypothetical protein Trydic_g16769 [Trypoxylus dichotomus]